MTFLDLEPLLGRDPDLIPISNSEIGTFKECRRKWWLTYYLGLGARSERKLGPLALGSRIHKCLELYYADGIDPVKTHDRLVEELRGQLQEDGFALADFEKEAELGRIMMEGYIPWLEETGADSSVDIIGAEKKLSVPLLDGKVELRGKVDLRVRRKIDGVRLLVDFKTAANRETVLRIAHMAWQIKLYQLLEHLTDDPEPVEGGRYRILKKVKRTATAKPPFYEDFDVRHNRKTIDSFWSSLHGVLNDMVSLRQHLDNGADPLLVAYPTPTNDCSWKCPFYRECPMFDNGEAVEEAVDAVFQQHDPYDRYEETS